MFELVFGWLWPEEGTFKGYTQKEGSEVVKQLFCKYKEDNTPYPTQRTKLPTR